MKKISLALILCILFTIVLTSCSTGTTDDTQTTDTVKVNDTETTAETTELLRENTPDSLPSDLNFNGADFRILHRTELDWQLEIAVESEIGEVVNDAVYARNRQVEERLGINIVSLGRPGVWDNTNNFLNYIRSTVQAGSDEFDLIAGYAYYLPALALEGLFINWNNVNYVNPNEVWWNADLAYEMTIYDKLFFIAGDLSFTMIGSMFNMFYNKLLATNYGLTDLYQTAFDGKFTIDYLSNTVKEIYSDLNGDGVRDTSDLYGAVITTGNQIDACFNAFDFPITQKNSEGIPELTLNTPKMIEMVNKMYTFCWENTGTYAIGESTAAQTSVLDMFIGDQAVFYFGTLSNSSSFRDMQSDYGVLPYPKWDEAQDHYQTAAQDAFSLFCIPITAGSRLDLIGASAEAMCAETYRKVIPAYYDVQLKDKFTRDPETAHMIDLIHDGLSFNFGTINSSSMTGVGHIYRDLVTSKNTDFSSTYSKNEAKYLSDLEKLVTAYSELQ
jgi:hypothetical protein